MKTLTQTIVTFFLALAISTGYSQVALKIYHGNGGTTEIISASNKSATISGNDAELLIKKGKKVTITIINPNPAFYTYQLNATNLKVSDENPDFSLLVEVLSSVIQQQAPTQSLGSARLLAAGALPAQFNLKIDNVVKDIQAAEKILTASDTPENIEEATIKSSTSINGFRSAIPRLQQLSSFTNENLKEELKDALAKESFDDTENDAMTAYINSLITAISTVKETFLSDSVKTQISLTYEVDDKPTKIEIKVTNKSKKHKLRDAGVISTITITPFQKNILEIAPLYSMVYSKGTDGFEIINGVITEKESDGFSFRPGAMLLLNITQFGDEKQFSVGPGLGYSIKQNSKVLQGFSIGAIVSFKNIVRMGIGWGMQQYPTKLINGATLGNPLPADTKLEDVTGYSNRSAFLIHFSLSGLTIKK